MRNHVQVEFDQIKTMVDGMATRISAPSCLLPTYGSSEDMGRPYVEIDAHGYHLIVVERGVEQYRTTVKSRDDLLFEIFRSVASAMAFEFERQQAQRDVDPRRVAFDKALSILGTLNKDWEKRQKEHYDRVLLKSPLRT
ncbi:Imm63 family immunity protein [Paraburkholderia dilworthii]|uniref:Imm63 family immunity protein n=1 Tax=Paraburkholderia dilworthii TaxID=948106 RepID=UPI000484CD0B|nr:Imm63 family immunity protein [Paraburkholderia dilworthii]